MKQPCEGLREVWSLPSSLLQESGNVADRRLKNAEIVRKWNEATTQWIQSLYIALSPGIKTSVRNILFVKFCPFFVDAPKLVRLHFLLKKALWTKITRIINNSGVGQLKRQDRGIHCCGVSSLSITREAVMRERLSILVEQTKDVGNAQ